MRPHRDKQQLVGSKAAILGLIMYVLTSAWFGVGCSYLLSRGADITFMTRSVPAFSISILVAAALLFALPAFAHEGHDHNDDDWNDDRTPACWIEARPNTVNYYGGQLTLSWETTDADWAEITDIGRVDVDSDSIRIPVYTSKTYTMTVYNGDESAECDTFVNIIGEHRSYGTNYPNYYYGQSYVQPISYVSLTQIPYTGFDFGPLGNGVYWATLIALAVFSAYLLVYMSGLRALASAPVIDEAVRAGRMQVEMVRGMFSRPVQAAAPSAPVVASVQEQTLVATRIGGDTMKVLEGSQPRIVITRE